MSVNDVEDDDDEESTVMQCALSSQLIFNEPPEPEITSEEVFYLLIAFLRHSLRITSEINDNLWLIPEIRLTDFSDISLKLFLRYVNLLGGNGMEEFIEYIIMGTKFPLSKEIIKKIKDIEQRFTVRGWNLSPFIDALSAGTPELTHIDESIDANSLSIMKGLVHFFTKYKISESVFTFPASSDDKCPYDEYLKKIPKDISSKINSCLEERDIKHIPPFVQRSLDECFFLLEPPTIHVLCLASTNDEHCEMWKQNLFDSFDMSRLHELYKKFNIEFDFIERMEELIQKLKALGK
jgi:hypothetical protein